MANIGKDFKEKIDQQWYDDSVDSHIEAWSERYSSYTSKKEVEFDLNVNYDPSIEIENSEEELGRKLTNEENDMLVKKFNKAVIKKINLREIRSRY
jgi:hypothetical protein